MSEFIDAIIGWLVGGSMVLGAAFMLLAAVGLIRLPDLPTRMHASTKAGTLGAALMMLAVAIYLPEPAVIARAFATIVFLFLTAPVGAHAIGRAAYFVGVPLWEGTRKDELAAQYDLESHGLESGGFPSRAEKIQALITPSVDESTAAAGDEDEKELEAGSDPVQAATEPEAVGIATSSVPVSDSDREPEEDVGEPTVMSLDHPDANPAEMMDDKEALAEAPEQDESEQDKSEQGKKKRKISEEIEA